MKIIDDESVYNAKKILLNSHEKWQKSHGKEGSRLDLSGANLVGAVFNGTDLRGADFTGANLQGSCLQNANVSSVKLEGAGFNWTDLVKARVISPKGIE